MGLSFLLPAQTKRRVFPVFLIMRKAIGAVCKRRSFCYPAHCVFLIINYYELGEVLLMQSLTQYTSEIKTVPFGGNGKTITIENLTPILTPKERERRKKEIEKRLFNVFIKYANEKND
jgi:hypothetical protein